MLIAVIILLALIVAAAVAMVAAYNRLIALKGQTDNAWKQIDVQLKRRHDLIPNLINAVKGAMQFEKETLESVISARNAAVTAAAGASPATAGTVASAEGALTAALTKFMAIVEAYPDLKATTNIGQLQEELASTENKVAFARQAYNDTATEYNVAQNSFQPFLWREWPGHLLHNSGRSLKKRIALCRPSTFR